MHPLLIAAAHAARTGPWTPKEGEAIIIAAIAITILALIAKLIRSN